MPRTVRSALIDIKDPGKAAFFPRFFKAGKGEYAEGDKFLGITVPQMREVAKEFRDLPLPQIEKLLKDPYHEMRLVALMILTMRYAKGDEKQKKQIVAFYLSHLEGVNNWDLVDLSAYKILGDWLLTRDRAVLYKLLKTKQLWKERIAIVSTFAFIRKNDFRDTLKISEMLLGHRHDLLHKAVGWMLREVGKKDPAVLRAFLKKHSTTLPRTALRYSIERFPEAERKQWMKK